MQSLLILAAAAALPNTATAQAAPVVCAPPEKPVNSEDYNPGFGRVAGLNDDFHDEFQDPLDRPGEVIGSLSQELAQDEEKGGVHLLRDVVGMTCSDD